MGPNKTYELLHRKETINKRKRQSIELGGGGGRKQCNQQGLNL